ncbi:dsDNA nuclease domain-containing protein [Streptococcus agalactiae]|uniref:dsDNA nuclease domain-containing protein n=1 Tax=Streptococcus agalactiae TaxID=1311 RepID=UPI00397B56D8
MAKDNGGAIAQKGFNYQNCVVSLVAIRNYKKPNFSIYVEADEDFEVMYDDDYHAYIQVKGQKGMSIKKLLSTTNNKPSIFEKIYRLVQMTLSIRLWCIILMKKT